MLPKVLSFDGRIRRSEYNISMLIFTIAIFFISYIADSGNQNGIVYAFLIPIYWLIWAQAVKRSHDIGNSGWYILIPFYSIWLIFRNSQPGPNQYGENPKEVQSTT